MFANRGRRPAASVAVLLAAATTLGGAAVRLLGACGPFTDVAQDTFCPFVLEIFYLGITTGTTATTYDPASNVSRLQMAAFLSRTVDGVLKRGSRRAALDQFWTTRDKSAVGMTPVGSSPRLVACDGTDVWVANNGSASVSRVRASDGRLLETWTGMSGAYGVLSAMGRIFVTGDSSKVYQIDPSQPAGAGTAVTSSLLSNAQELTFDGLRIWTAETGGVSIITPGAGLSWTTTNVAGFGVPRGILFDGTNVWTTDAGASLLLKLDAAGNVLQTVTVGTQPTFPAFDGTNIWVPSNVGVHVDVVRASTGAILATMTDNGMAFPMAAAFDGQRILVTNEAGDSVSLFKAADLTPLGSFSLPITSAPWGACSDGLNFWIALPGPAALARF